jgi:hypothetical protein
MAAPEPGRYVCLRTRALAGGIIRIATRSEYDHVILVGPGGSTIEATPSRGVHIGSLDAYKGLKACADLGDELDGPTLDAILAAARRYLGDGYGWPTIGWDALAELGWHWKLLLRICRAGKRLVCSQLVAQAGADAGVTQWLCGKSSAVPVKPSDLARRPGVEPVTL